MQKKANFLLEKKECNHLPTKIGHLYLFKEASISLSVALSKDSQYQSEKYHI